MRFTLFLLIVFISTVSYAQRGGGRTPPQEAFDACSGIGSGDSCTVQTPHGQLNGSCKSPPGVNSLVCVPDHGSRGNAGMGGGGQQRMMSGGSRNSSMGEGGSNRPPMRKHTVTQSDGVKSLVPATEYPSQNQYYRTMVEGQWRVIKSNAIPDHKIGKFPNSGNPHSVEEQDFDIRVPAYPQLSSRATNVKIPGWVLNGVPFDPGAGEYYKGDRNSGWQYEALSGAVTLGIDENHAHVQPGGKYHYHGLPTLFMKKAGVRSGKHSPQIGWAADGFPIYALYGYKGGDDESGIKKMRSSYRLKSGQRPSGSGQPGGTYDGTFTADYEYVQGAGDLDECNGMKTATPEYPEGTYAYFLTENYPVVPRCVMGVVN